MAGAAERGFAAILAAFATGLVALAVVRTSHVQAQMLLSDICLYRNVSRYYNLTDQNGYAAAPARMFVAPG